MVASGKPPAAIVAERGLAQISDEAALAEIIAALLRDNPKEVAAYKAGNEELKGWFVCQVMRATRGQAHPALVNRLHAEQLSQT